MSAKRSRAPRAPKYLLHRPSGRAFSYVYEDGKRRQVYLGQWESPESYREYRRIAALSLAGKPVTAPGEGPRDVDEGPTVAELCAAFLLWAERRYRDRDREPTRQADNFKLAVAPLLKLYRDLPTRDFDITCLKLVREDM